MSKSTMVELVKELEKLKPSIAKDQMINAAKKGSFHDYKSEAICGKMFFVECSSWFKRQKVSDSDIDLMNRLEEEIKDGVYDEVADGEDKERMRKDISAYTSSEDQAGALSKMLGL